MHVLILVVGSMILSGIIITLAYKFPPTQANPVSYDGHPPYGYDD
jgi:hypothetical protein